MRESHPLNDEVFMSRSSREIIPFFLWSILVGPGEPSPVRKRTTGGPGCSSPGFGSSLWAEELLVVCLAVGLPLVILRGFCTNGWQDASAMVKTPYPGLGMVLDIGGLWENRWPW